jgi:16S rRNA (adenine1518-N6/adenine1519-N6)-dimethyltransferase
MNARELIARHGVRAKKSWGQNFLADERALEAIARSSGAGPDDVVVEIGAGLGTLTLHLAAHAGRVIAVERDRDMVAVLRAELSGDARIEIAEQNALELDYRALSRAAGRRLIVVGNLPYQLASPLLFRVLEARGAVARAVVMLQREMAERVVAPPGGRDYGALTAMVRMVADARIVLRVPAGAFVPAPRVASAVVRLDLLDGTRAPVRDEAHFSKVVHAAFGQRRKTLRNALKAIAPPASIERALAAAAIDGGRRGETLDVAELARLADALEVSPA